MNPSRGLKLSIPAMKSNKGLVDLTRFYTRGMHTRSKFRKVENFTGGGFLLLTMIKTMEPSILQMEQILIGAFSI